MQTSNKVQEIMEICQTGSSSNCEHVISSILTDIAALERERVIEQIREEQKLRITKIPLLKRIKLVYTLLLDPKMMLNMHRLVVLDLLYQRVRNLKWTNENRP